MFHNAHSSHYNSNSYTQDIGKTYDFNITKKLMVLTFPTEEKHFISFFSVFYVIKCVRGNFRVCGNGFLFYFFTFQHIFHYKGFSIRKNSVDCNVNTEFTIHCQNFCFWTLKVLYLYEVHESNGNLYVKLLLKLNRNGWVS